MNHSYKATLPAVVAGVVAFGASTDLARADDQVMTARVVSEKMTAAELTAYLAGIVEGLGHARFVKDGKIADGRSCIYRWFYDDKSTQRKINDAFERYPDALPGQIIGALVAVKCGA